jgi:hypothetical protein
MELYLLILLTRGGCANVQLCECAAVVFCDRDLCVKMHESMQQVFSYLTNK